MEQAPLTLWGRAAAVVVLTLAAFDPIVRHTPPLTAVWLAGLAVAILLQSGRPSRLRTWLGRGVAAATAVTAAGVLVGYLAGKSFGPPTRTAASVLYLSGAVMLMRVDRRRFGLLWGICLLAAAATPLATVMGHMFKDVSDVILTESTGQRISTAVAVLLLVAATVLARPDRNPIAWLLTRPDRWALLRLVGVLGGLPLLVSVSRLPILALGLGTEAAWILATTIATLIAGVAVFYLSQREQGLLIDKELLSRQRAEAEMRYRILADNAVDVVFHLHGSSVTWVSPSVAAAFGEPAPQWIGSDLRLRIHPDDLEAVATAVRGLRPDKPVLARFRVRTADGGYHWVDGNAKPYIDADGNPDGLIAALRTVDDQVEAQQRLDRLARFDTLTGLPNRAEVIGRLESALEQPRSPGTDLGILFCDVDHFKTINDTLGHAAGDVVLATLAARISESIRQGDTVGRVGGDEMVVLLPGVHSLDEAALIAEKIRCRAAQPIHHDGRTIQATLSIGATVSVSGESATEVTARADEAMYQAKQARRNTVVQI
jgi:diguanylate cyclase (GGDEF)-like protein/PAS domain S-box-containing protein